MEHEDPFLGRYIYGYLEKGMQTTMAQGRSTKIISMIKWIRTSRLSIKNYLARHAPYGVRRNGWNTWIPPPSLETPPYTLHPHPTVYLLTSIPLTLLSHPTPYSLIPHPTSRGDRFRAPGTVKCWARVGGADGGGGQTWRGTRRTGSGGMGGTRGSSPRRSTPLAAVGFGVWGLV